MLKNKQKTYRRSRRRKHPFRWVTILLVFIIAGFGVFSIFNLLNKKEESDTPQQEEVKEEIKAETVENSPSYIPSGEEKEGSDIKVDENQTPIQNEGVENIQASDFSGTINSTGMQGDGSNRTFYILTTINQQTGTSGRCDLTMTKGSNIYKETVKTANLPSSATCQGFEIPASKLSAGEWKISIKITAGDKTGYIEGKANVEE